MPALVSVVVPSYNHARYLPALFEALLAQTWADTELLLIDDGSKDGSAAVIAQYEPRLRERFRRFFFRARENRGVAVTQNELIAEARGEYLFFCASDDRPQPRAIETLVTHLEHATDAVMACGDATFIDAEGAQVFLRPDGEPTRERTGNFETLMAFTLRARPTLQRDGDFGRHHTLLAGNYIPVGLLLRTAATRQALPYPEGMVLEDLYIWLKLSRLGRFIAIDDRLMEYRVHGANVSRTRQERMRADHFQLLLGERDYAASTGHLDDWQRAMESVIKLRGGLRELQQARAAGFDTVRFLRRRALAHLRRLLR